MVSVGLFPLSIKYCIYYFFDKNMELLKHVANKQLKDKVPKLRPGNIVAVHQRIKEGSKERIQVFKGIVIRVKGGYGINGSFTVRKIASGVGVEKSFLFNSPLVEKIEVTKTAKVRRAKLYYLAGREGKAARLNLLANGGNVEELVRNVADKSEIVEKQESPEEQVKSDKEESKETDKEVKAEAKKESDEDIDEKKKEKKTTKKESKKEEK